MNTRLAAFLLVCSGVNDVVRLSSPTDALAVAVPDLVEVSLPYDFPLVDGYAEMPVRVGQSGIHLEAFVGADPNPDTVQAGEQFLLTVRYVNDEGIVIPDLSSTVDVQVRHAETGDPGVGTLSNTRFEVLQGQRVVPEVYTFAEPIVLVIQDEASNSAITEPVTVLGTTNVEGKTWSKVKENYRW